MSLDSALHHCASIVVFDVAFPARLGQVVILREALLAEVLDGVVISIGQKVVQLLGLRVVLKLVHQAGPIALNLLLRRDRQKHDLGKLLRVEGSEDAASQDLGLLALLLLDDDHGFVHSVHHQAYDVGAGHARQLLGDNVFQVNQVTHVFQSPTQSTVIR